MNTNQPTTPTRQAVINGLAIVGFIALVVAGIWLAVYSTRFVPTVVNRIGAAAVYLGSVFTSAPDSTVSVVPTPSASTTISFDTETTPPASTTTTKTTPPKPAATVGTKTTSTYQVRVATTTVTPYGLSDLFVTVDAIGYLTTASTDSFVVSPTVPDNERPAVKFTVKNIGTNWSGTWRFSVDIPLNRSLSASSFDTCESAGSGVQRCTSFVQQTLGPGDWIDYTLGFDRARTGSDQPITIIVNGDRTAIESNTNNNTATVKITVLD